MDVRTEAAVPVVSAGWRDWIRKDFQVGGRHRSGSVFWTSADLRDVWVGSLYSRAAISKKELQIFGFVLVPQSVMERLMVSSLSLPFFLFADAKHLCYCYHHDHIFLLLQNVLLFQENVIYSNKKKTLTLVSNKLETIGGTSFYFSFFCIYDVLESFFIK